MQPSHSGMGACCITHCLHMGYLSALEEFEDGAFESLRHRTGTFLRWLRLSKPAHLQCKQRALTFGFTYNQIGLGIIEGVLMGLRGKFRMQKKRFSEVVERALNDGPQEITMHEKKLLFCFRWVSIQTQTPQRDACRILQTVTIGCCRH